MGDGASRVKQAQGLTDARKKLIFNEYILYSIWKRILYYIPERVLFFSLTSSLQERDFIVILLLHWKMQVQRVQ